MEDKYETALWKKDLCLLMHVPLWASHWVSCTLHGQRFLECKILHHLCISQTIFRSFYKHWVLLFTRSYSIWALVPKILCLRWMRNCC